MILTSEAEKFLTKYALARSYCKQCGKDIWIFLLRGQPRSINIDLTDHEHAVAAANKSIKEIVKEPGGNGI